MAQSRRFDRRRHGLRLRHSDQQEPRRQGTCSATAKPTGHGVLPTFTFINTGFHIDASFFIKMEFSVLNRNAFDLLFGDDEKSKLSSFISSDMMRISMDMEANQDVSLPHRSDIQILSVCSSRSACRLNYTYPKTLSTFAHYISGPRPVCLATR
jgi:hypothetical protein